MLLVAASTRAWCVGNQWKIASPDQKTQVEVDTQNQRLTWCIAHNGVSVLEASEINILIDGTLTKFATPFYKKAEVKDEYNAMTVTFKNGISIEFRVYNDGAAYRFLLNRKNMTEVTSETAEFLFAEDYPAFVPYVNDNRGGERYCYSFESYYDEQPLSAMFSDSLAITPLAVCLPNGLKAIVMDAGVEDYPGMFLKRIGVRGLKAEFAPYPLEQEIGGPSGPAILRSWMDSGRCLGALSSSQRKMLTF